MRNSDAKCTAAPMNRWGIGSYRNKRQHGYRTHSIKSMLRHSPVRLKKLTGFDAKSIDWIHKLIVCKWSVGRLCVSVGVCVRLRWTQEEMCRQAFNSRLFPAVSVCRGVWLMIHSRWLIWISTCCSIISLRGSRFTWKGGTEPSGFIHAIRLNRANRWPNKC